MRQFGIRVSVIEPDFTRTNIAQNSQVAARALEAYANGRTRVLNAIPEDIAKGGTPLGVAEVVLKALTSRSPRPRYSVGREVKLIGGLRKFAPSSLFDRGLRKQFRLDPCLTTGESSFFGKLSARSSAFGLRRTTGGTFGGGSRHFLDCRRPTLGFDDAA